MLFVCYSNLCAFLLFEFVVLRESECTNFPVEGCSTDKMDVLCLYYDSRRSIERDTQHKICHRFINDLVNFNKTAPRVMSADVYDRFSTNNARVNISSWSFNSSLGASPYGDNYQPITKQRYINVQEVIELKVMFVQRLFSEMGGVRENVAHITVVFLDGDALSHDECRRIPHSLQQRDTGVKVFVVVVNALLDTRDVLLNDTLIVSSGINDWSYHGLTMAICNQCMEGWFSFRHPDGSDSLSCYHLLDSQRQINGYSAQYTCEYDGGLASVETIDELVFLQRVFRGHILNRGRQGTKSDDLSQLPTDRERRGDDLSQLPTDRERQGDDLSQLPTDSGRQGDDLSQLPTDVFIGLYKVKTGGTRRFKWQLTDPPLQLRPLVVNNWLPGKPSGGYDSRCVVWRFTWAAHGNDVNVSTNKEASLTDGWLDAECKTPLGSLSLCEVILPRRIEGNKLLTINEASAERMSLALAKGTLVNFRGNIVSVSANMASTDFLDFLKEDGQELFPHFDCGIDAGTPRFVSYLYVCDYIDHCRNKRDEQSCLLGPRDELYNRNQDESVKNCNGVLCCDGTCLPLEWVNDGQIDCAVCVYKSDQILDDESTLLHKYMQRNKTCALICGDDQCVTFSQLGDGIQDCYGPEGAVDETLGVLEKAGTCYNSFGYPIWAPKCVYVRDRYGAVLGCRDVSHLTNCTDFKCPEGYFKCPNNYCIPQHYVLDRIFDCPTGEDEETDIIGSCSGNFACWDSLMCLHPDLVCDGHPDCPHKDDEVDCHEYCPSGLRCGAGTISVSTYNKSLPIEELSLGDDTTRYLDLSGLDLSSVGQQFLYYLKKAAFVKLSGCKIMNLLDFFDYKARVIQELDLSYNLIQTMDGSDTDFSALENIRHLNLSYNRQFVSITCVLFTFLEILDISNTGLPYLNISLPIVIPNLKHLNLSNTYISSFYKYLFTSKLFLMTLDVRGLHVKDVREDLFNGLYVSQHLYTDMFELCCPQIKGPNIPYYSCHAPARAISSCFDLVGVNVQRVLLWVVAVLAVLGNMMVIGYRVIWDREILRTGYGVFVTNLGISDFIMGVYLFIIAGADYYYGGVYVLFDKTWRESVTCSLAGFLATLSSETSTFFVLLITLDRFIMMKFPVRNIQFVQISKAVSVISSWIIALFLAVVPILFRLEIYSQNAMCLGLPLTNKRHVGWMFSFGLFIVFNFIMCLIIAYGQRAIFRAMSKNRITGPASRTSSRRLQDMLVAKQLSLVALSNFLCWFPIGLMGLLSLVGLEVNNDVYAWTTVIVLPINSAVNPLLYTIPKIMARWAEFKDASSRHSSSGT